ncbi:hypothetical protein EYF80_021060 [Liparis tanakae]|uniref:Uncharacterized protein n=1 Tax=Liparis tanakae TaxID=230148 RepID=A0A4Z2HSK6_9TELE|nr:hypothetical protein EYF80_021060 [Liparis tanakae]
MPKHTTRCSDNGLRLQFSCPGTHKHGLTEPGNEPPLPGWKDDPTPSLTTAGLTQTACLCPWASPRDKNLTVLGGGGVKTAKRPAIAAHRGNRAVQATWRLSIHRNDVTDSFMSPGDERRRPRLDGKLREITTMFSLGN